MKILHPLPGQGDKVTEAEWTGGHQLLATHLGTISGSVTLDVADGPKQLAEIDDALLLSLPVLPYGVSEQITLILTNDGAEHAVVVTGVKWVHGSAPDLDDDDEAQNILIFSGTSDGWIADGGKLA